MPPPLARIETPLGDDLLFLGMRGDAELGRMFSYDLTLVSKRPDIDFRQVLAKRVKVSLEVPGQKPRVFSGYVTGFRQAGMRGRAYVYRAALRPWLWLLTRRSNCRMFQDKSVEDIVKAIFADPVYAGVETGEIKWKASSRTHPRREYCVQYRESDFNFVSRLLEDEGIYYWFDDRDGHESLIFTDTLAMHESAPGCDSLPYGAMQGASPDLPYVSEWQTHYEIETHNWLLTDYDFKHPSRILQKHAVKEMPGFSAFADLEHFDFPGGYVDPDYGESRVKTRADEWQENAGSAGSGHELPAQDWHAFNWHQVDGCTNSGSVRAGSLLSLERHPRADQNTQYLVTRTHYEIELADREAFEGAQSSRCECRFAAISAKQPFTPARTSRKPFVQGPQTAVVVGPASEELYTDKYGRVKVQFFWDRLGKRDENSSCWMRVSQPLAGKGWGSVSIPRIGQEVIVDFLEGDPDRPIITGRVYNAEQMPPFSLPGDAVVSGMKSNTHKGHGYNEMSMNDTAGKEKITIHAQYDMGSTIKHDKTTTVQNNRTDHIQVDDAHTVDGTHTVKVGKEQKVTIGTNRVKTVGGTENTTITGHRTETVNSGETVTVHGGRDHTVTGVQKTTITVAEMHSVGAGRMHNVGAGETVTIAGVQMVSVGLAQMVSVGGAQKVNVGPLQSITVKGSHKLSAAVIDQTSKGVFKVKAGGACTVEAPTITLKAGGSKIVMESGGITISGAKITIKSDGGASFKAGGAITIKGSNLGED